MFALRLPQSPAFTFTIDGARLSCSMRWNAMDQHWNFTADFDGQRIVTGRRVVNLQPLLSDIRIGGDLMAFPLHLQDDDPSRHSWGHTHDLVALNAYERALL